MRGKSYVHLHREADAVGAVEFFIQRLFARFDANFTKLLCLGNYRKLCFVSSG